jgi:hypothetical protein
MNNNQPLYFAKESQLQSYVVKWIRKEYPGTHFRTDYFADQYCPSYIKEQFSSQQSGSGYPDIHIIHKTRLYSCLYIETKLSKDKVFRKDGITLLYSEHLCNQFQYHEYLRAQGCAVVFGLGLTHIQQTIIAYMAGKCVEQTCFGKKWVDKAKGEVDKKADEFFSKQNIT